MDQEVRKKFPTITKKINSKKLIYFDNACSMLKSSDVVKSISDYYLNYSCCGGDRSSHFLARKVDENINRTREELRLFIGASPASEIIFTSGATESINLIASSFPFRPSKNEVIISDLEHNSNFLPFLRLEKEGKIKLRIFKTNNGKINISDFKKKITSRTALISLSQASNLRGASFDLKKIVKASKEKGIRILLDSSQYISSNKINFDKLEVNYLVFSAHKIGGPTGLGVLCAQKESLDILSEYKTGGGVIKKINFLKNIEAVYLDGSKKFEAGTPNISAIFGFRAAINIINDIGYKKIRNHISHLVECLFDQLVIIKEIEIIGNKNELKKGSLVSFYFKDKSISEDDFNIYLNNDFNNYLIALRVGQHCANLAHRKVVKNSSIRVSFAFYNTEEEIDIFIKALNGFLRINNK